MKDLLPHENTDEAFWTNIVRILTYSACFFAGSDWFTQNKIREPHEYVQDAIIWYLENPDKYNPDRGSITTFLTYKIRTLISNDRNLKENTTRSQLSLSNTTDTDEDYAGYDYDALLVLGIENSLVNEIDAKKEVSMIQQTVHDLPKSKNKEIMENILLGLYNENKPAETKKEFNLTQNEYTNGLRRLHTIATQVRRKLKAT